MKEKKIGRERIVPGTDRAESLRPNKLGETYILTSEARILVSVQVGQVLLEFFSSTHRWHHLPNPSRLPCLLALWVILLSSRGHQ